MLHLPVPSNTCCTTWARKKLTDMFIMYCKCWRQWAVQVLVLATLRTRVPTPIHAIMCNTPRARTRNPSPHCAQLHRARTHATEMHIQAQACCMVCRTHACFVTSVAARLVNRVASKPNSEHECVDVRRVARHRSVACTPWASTHPK